MSYGKSLVLFITMSRNVNALQMVMASSVLLYFLSSFDFFDECQTGIFTLVC